MEFDNYIQTVLEAYDMSIAHYVEQLDWAEMPNHSTYQNFAWKQLIDIAAKSTANAVAIKKALSAKKRELSKKQKVYNWDNELANGLEQKYQTAHQEERPTIKAIIDYLKK